MAVQGKELTDKELSEAIGNLKVGFTKGYSIVEACLYSKINRATYYKYFGDDEELQAEFEECKSNPTMLAKDNIMSSLAGGDINTSKYVLDRKDPEYKPVATTKHVTDDGNGGDAPINNPIDLSKLSDHALDELKRAYPSSD